MASSLELRHEYFTRTKHEYFWREIKGGGVMRAGSDMSGVQWSGVRSANGCGYVG